MGREESPEYLRMSLAAAMTLDFAPGTFYRGACLRCVNLLLTYTSGCAAKCAYCGLSGSSKAKQGKGRFIRVSWPAFALDAVVAAIAERQDKVQRICISMLTNRRAVQDTQTVCRRLREALDIPISLLISPTVLHHGDLDVFREAGADKVGVAIDLATPELFDRYRGTGVNGPHKWDTYWQCLEQALEVFGSGNAGSHFIVGMGETERQMCAVMQRVRDMGGRTHLFSFFPEADSALEDNRRPPITQYRRIQMARFLIDESISHAGSFTFDAQDKVTNFGVSPQKLEDIVERGTAFCTSGCTGRDGKVACNRPYANSRPGPGIRNYPFQPEAADIVRIRQQMDVARF
ncbi:MAG: radical SAM protein [Desulfovibrio sp.]|jgi:biotin synthase|nr:radical SAM protein [Desulfovibrio sp.]